MSLELVPITFSEAAAFVNAFHRHHIAPVGHKYSIALSENEQIIGVVIVSRPVSRHEDNGFTLEVTRLCVIEGYQNACSRLYAAAWRVAKNLGYKRLITYILETERGISLKAAGMKCVGKVRGESWNRKKRVRFDKHPTCNKLKFEIS